MRQLTDSSQVVTDDYSFDAWGTLVSSTGSTANSQLWKGQYLAYRKDPDAGPEVQYAMHHRNYNPKTGVFTSADPAKADLNLYRYVKNNPVNRTDPSGLVPNGLKIEDDGRRNFWINNKIIATREMSSKPIWSASPAFGEGPIGVDADYVSRLIGSALKGEASRSYRVPFQFFDQFVEQTGFATLGGWTEEQWDDWFRQHDAVNNPNATKPPEPVESEEISIPEPTSTPTDWTQHPGRGAEAEVLAGPGFKEDQKFGDIGTELTAGFLFFTKEERQEIIDALERVQSANVAAADIAVGFIPVLGDFKDLAEGITGKGVLDGEKIGLFWRFAAVFAAVIPFVSAKTLRRIVEFIQRMRQRLKLAPDSDAARIVLAKLDEAEDVVRRNPKQDLSSGRETAETAETAFRRVGEYRHLHHAWLRHIDNVIDDIIATGRPKIIVLGQGGQGKIISFANRDPRRVTEFYELTPSSLKLKEKLDEAKRIRDWETVSEIDTMTLDFNLLLIRRLFERGFQFEVLGEIGSSTAATSFWLRKELELLESLNVKWSNISQNRIDEVLDMAAWGRPRR